jgi:hypothetical protein
MPELDQEVESVFLAALDRATAQERAAFVEETCAVKPELLQRLRELLEAHDQFEGPLDVQLPVPAAPIDEPMI